MFNKILFDRNAFDRNVAPEGLSGRFDGYGNISAKVVFQFPIIGTIQGKGSMNIDATVRQRLALTIEGTSNVVEITPTLRLRLENVKLKGQGIFDSGLAIRTPIYLDLSGDGELNLSDRIRMRQFIEPTLKGAGDLDPGVLLKVDIISDMYGSSHMEADALGLKIVIGGNLKGSGDLTLRRLTNLNETIFELVDINLLPGESVTIDTDLLQVLFGHIENVDAVTTDSVFFDLTPGDNEILISTDTEEELEVDVIWQNRWL